MANDHFILPLRFKDLSQATRDFTDEEFGAYVRLLIHQWDRGSIPKNIKRQRLIAESIETTGATVIPKFDIVMDNSMQNSNMEKIRNENKEFSSKQSGNGKKGGNPAFKKGVANPYYPKDNPEHKAGDNPELLPIILPKDKPSSQSPSPSLSYSQPSDRPTDDIVFAFFEHNRPDWRTQDQVKKLAEKFIAFCENLGWEKIMNWKAMAIKSFIEKEVPVAEEYQTTNTQREI